MKGKLTIRKSRSPSGREPNDEGEVGDEVEEDKQRKQIPNTLVVNKKGIRLARADLSNTTALFGRKARSNSPKEMGPIKLNTNIRQQIYKHHSPVPIKNPVAETSRVKDANPFHINVPEPPLHGGMITKQASPRTQRLKMSPERVQQLGGIIHIGGGSNSPRPGRFQPFEPEETKALKALARRKRQLNEDLWEAADNGDVVKISRLLEPARKGEPVADINSTGIENRTALHCAVYENKVDAAKLLLRYGATPDARTVHYRTPLHIACILGEDLMCKILIEAGAAVNTQDFEKNTPVHYAAFYKNIRILKLILEKKPDLTIKNKKGQTAIDITNSKTIISIFWHYLTGSTDSNTSEDNKALMTTAKGPYPLPRTHPIKKGSAKLVISEATKAKPKSYQDPRIIKTSKDKDLVESETLSAADSSGSSSNSKRSKRSELNEGKKYSSGNTSLSSTGGEPEKVGLEAFQPVQLIGKGSFGEVYLVRKKTTGKYYAMKILSKHMIIGQNLSKYAYTERNVQSGLRHPFIVRLHCAFQTKTKLFLVMDYCRGGDLGHVLQREKKLSEERARIYLAEVLLAIEELHSREIIYRDLKPDNVVLDEEGHAHLTDFGLSKEGVKDTDFTQSFCGSVAYLAPEMLRRSGHGRSVDWYLLGVLLYEMIVGIPPYFNRNKEKLFDNIKRGPLQVPSDMSSDALDLIVKLLNRDPRQRLGAGPGDAEEIKEHPFFKSINWDLAMRRKLKPPKPHIRPIVETGVSFDIYKDPEPGEDDQSRMNRWTFISKDFK